MAVARDFAGPTPAAASWSDGEFMVTPGAAVGERLLWPRLALTEGLSARDSRPGGAACWPYRPAGKRACVHVFNLMKDCP